MGNDNIMFKNKYRIPSIRAQWWDYGRNATYYITICTANRKCFFGNVINKKMHLSSIGIIANVFWHEIKKHTNFIELGEFVVMPNHIHGILIIDKQNIIDTTITMDAMDTMGAMDATVATTVETRHALSLQTHPQSHPHQQSHPHHKPPITSPIQTPGQKRFRNPGMHTISSIIGGYKSAVTNHAHRLGYDFEWQPRFYDNIVKNENEYKRIAKYIIDNPANWHYDKFF